ncbi:hypothetical protein [Anaeromyxobacter oryzae]|uniref:Lipoprotein n=1 Tax=Anaeromyxobacter oryzae TaxID=2918170 RepID=A0ABN6MM76_9BACT|nr:hypothetical protein [Anaeromyxobacter oryzae]BDG02153.1 hypothetical protein AMOR_11490 [Anaeromyxobacter oryzae]
MCSRSAALAVAALAAVTACCAPARESPDAAAPPDRAAATTSRGSAPVGLHGTCPETGCPAGQRCIEWCGVAGCRPGLVFRTCEIPCKTDAQCPAGLACATIADGPGQVCDGGGAAAPRQDGPRE